MYAGTSGTAEHVKAALQSMADDSGVTILAMRGQLIDGALKTVKGMLLPVHHDFKSIFVGISTVLTSFHVILLGMLGIDANLIPREFMTGRIGQKKGGPLPGPLRILVTA